MLVDVSAGLPRELLELSLHSLVSPEIDSGGAGINDEEATGATRIVVRQDSRLSLMLSSCLLMACESALFNVSDHLLK